MERINEFAIATFVRMQNVIRREEGQGLVEYALIIALVAILLVGALTTLQIGIGETFADISGTLNPAE